MNKISTYIKSDGETAEYNYKETLSLSEKASLIYEVANLVVPKNIGYMAVFKVPMFEYCLIKYMTDIDMFEGGEFDIDVLEQFLLNNNDVVDMLNEALSHTTINQLSDACNKAIAFRQSHMTDISELLSAVINWFSSFANHSIDMDVVGKLADIVPLLNQVGGKDVAKAIISDYHKNDKDEAEITSGTDKGIEILK